MTGVVAIGVDGSSQSLEALRWAADYAQLAGAALRLVTAWHLPPVMAEAGLIPSDLEEGARRTVEAAASAVRSSHPALALTTVVEEGPAAQVLLEQAMIADLLVVGSRGHGAFAGMLLGSVSTHCIHHARCPVVVVPDEKR